VLDKPPQKKLGKLQQKKPDKPPQQKHKDVLR
jgi:hypothetical protein